MPVRTQVTIRGKPVSVVGSGSKSDIARALLDQGYSVSEISKAVPMAYSQVHSIDKKRPKRLQVAVVGNAGTGRTYILPEKPATKKRDNTAWGDLPKKGQPTTRPQKAQILKRAEKTLAARPKPSTRVGKLRTPGLPSDIDVGRCANCEHDVAVRRGTGGLFLMHINVTAEEYLSVTQFCQAVPEVLVK